MKFKWFTFLFPVLLCIALITVLSVRIKEVPAIGALLNPFWGVWQNAENINSNELEDVKLTGLYGAVQVSYDENRVPHIFANNYHDAYMVQGYITAHDRLWQMEIQTHAAAGRVSEVLGSKMVEFDRKQRRKGMVYAAENCLLEINKDSVTKTMVESYTDGVNAYIEQLSGKQMPVEYKLLGYKPEPWTMLKCALLLKLMADDLSGACNDFSYTNALKAYGGAIFDKLYPDFQPYISPIVPKGTEFQKNQALSKTTNSTIPNTNNFIINDTTKKPEMPVGSNNWAVSGTKTKSGFPILCGDPHLKLSLPSIWYQIQLTIKDKTVNGVSLPGGPGVIIGFNDSCAWSMTNAERDVKDFYKIQFKDASQQEYLLDSVWVKTTKKIERIVVKNKADVLDTVYYTKFGPVMYDKNFESEKGNLAIKWMSHLPSNEFKTIYLLDNANNFNDYYQALQYYTSPAQNFVFACKDNTIAIYEQGRFVDKIQNEGKFIETGNSISKNWNTFIPFSDNPHCINPLRGFVSSANQQPTDATYPYYYYGDYYEYRSLIINEYLASMNNITIDNMMHLQNNNYALWIEDFKNVIMQQKNFDALSKNDLVQKAWRWNLQNTPENVYTVFFKLWYDNLLHATFDDDFSVHNVAMDYPNKDVFLRMIIQDSTFQFFDNINTFKHKENLSDLLTTSLNKTLLQYDTLQKKNNIAWSKYRNTTIAHLAKLAPFSVPVNCGGESNSVNAISSTNGPSWRMIVSLTPNTDAYGIYPGGQSGNIGSPFYDNFIVKWQNAQYNTIKVLDKNDPAIIKQNFTN